MLEIGQKLVCKKTAVLHDPWPIVLKEGDCYEVVDINNASFILNIISVRNAGTKLYDNFVSFNKTKGKYKTYIWNYFYTPAEWRDKQLESILC